MTTATSMLRNEHKAILKMLDATEEVARRLTTQKTTLTFLIWHYEIQIHKSYCSFHRFAHRKFVV